MDLGFSSFIIRILISKKGFRMIFENFHWGPQNFSLGSSRLFTWVHKIFHLGLQVFLLGFLEFFTWVTINLY